MGLLARPDHPRRELTKCGTIPPVPKNFDERTLTPWATRPGRFACRLLSAQPGFGSPHAAATGMVANASLTRVHHRGIVAWSVASLRGDIRGVKRCLREGWL